MAREWKEIQESEDYQALSQNSKNALKERYFSEVVTNRKDYTELSEQSQKVVKANFLKKPSLYKAVNADITPGDEASYPLLSATAETAQEGVATPALHFVNQALFNTPRAVTESLGYEFPESEGIPANILSKGAGIAGAMVGGPAKLYKATSQAIAKHVPKLVGKGVQKGITKGAIKGAITGAAYTPSDSDIPILAPKERAQQAVVGAFLSGIVEGVGAGYRSFKAAKLRKSKPSLEQRLKMTQQDKNLEREVLRANIKSRNKAAINIQNENNKILAQDLQRSVDEGIPISRESLKLYTKALTETYDARLSDVADDIGNQITRRDAFTFFDGLAKKLSKVEDFKGTNALGQVKALAKRYKHTDKSATRGVPFKQVLARTKKVLGGRNFQTDTSVDDLVRDELRAEFGNFVGGYTDDFANLQAEMAPALEMKKFANSLFLRGTNKQNANRARNLLVKHAQGKTSKEEAVLIDGMNRELAKFNTDVLTLSNEARNIGTKLAKGKKFIDTTKLAEQAALADIQKQALTSKTNFLARSKKVRGIETEKKAQFMEKVKKGLSPDKLLDYAIKYALIRTMYKVGKNFRQEDLSSGGGG